ncbi:MAG: PaaI family thioesterase [Dysgonomonas sp.]|nr:PaaI family thioesterase [Dysgonomonas sp.]
MRLNKNNMEERIKDTMMDTLRMEFIETDEPTMEMRMPVGRFNCQTMGVLHGGATVALAETASGVGSNLLCREDEECYGIQISASHISSAKLGDVVKAIAVPQHIGRSTHVWNVDIFSMTDDRLISTIKVTNFVKRKK